MTQTPNQPELEAEATPDNDIDDTFKNYRRQIINGLQEGAKFSNSATIAEKTAKAALTRNRDIYAARQACTELEKLSSKLNHDLEVNKPVLLMINDQLAVLRAQLAALEGTQP
jgi:hypothetical protein